jgi:hypothetical protein
MAVEQKNKMNIFDNLNIVTKKKKNNDNLPYYELSFLDNNLYKNIHSSFLELGFKLINNEWFQLVD